MSISWVTVENAIVNWIATASGFGTGRIWWEAASPSTQRAKPYIAIRFLGERNVGRDWVDVVPVPLVIADDVVESVSAAADTLTLTAHGLFTGDGPIRFTTTGTLPAGLALATDYFVIRSSANAIQVATSNANAQNGIPIDITGTGTGTHTLVDTAATERAGAEIAFHVRGNRIYSLQMQAFTDSTTTTNAIQILNDVKSKTRLPSIYEALSAVGVSVLTFENANSLDAIINTTQIESRAVMLARLSLASDISETGTYIDTVSGTAVISTPAGTKNIVL